jgi:AcrR family transcriptional regulator
MNALRADAARNLDAVLHTGAEVLARDPSASIAAIAAEAGVDRTTVYRRFPNRGALLAGVYAAKLDAAEAVFEEARLEEAPVPVALHRFAEGVVTISREWPLHVEGLRDDPVAGPRADAQRARVDAFLERAVAEGIVRDDLPPLWARTTLLALIDLAAHQFPDLAPGRAADLVVETFLRGVSPART